MAIEVASIKHCRRSWKERLFLKIDLSFKTLANRPLKARLPRLLKTPLANRAISLLSRQATLLII